MRASKAKVHSLGSSLTVWIRDIQGHMTAYRGDLPRTASHSVTIPIPVTTLTLSPPPSCQLYLCPGDLFTIWPSALNCWLPYPSTLNNPLLLPRLSIVTDNQLILGMNDIQNYTPLNSSINPTLISQLFLSPLSQFSIEISRFPLTVQAMSIKLQHKVKCFGETILLLILWSTRP